MTPDAERWLQELEDGVKATLEVKSPLWRKVAYAYLYATGERIGQIHHEIRDLAAKGS